MTPIRSTTQSSSDQIDAPGEHKSERSLSELTAQALARSPQICRLQAHKLCRFNVHAHLSCIGEAPFPLGGKVFIVECEEGHDWANPHGPSEHLGPGVVRYLGPLAATFGLAKKANLALLPDAEAVNASIAYFNARVSKERAIVAQPVEVPGSVALTEEGFSKHLESEQWPVASSGAFLYHDTWVHVPALIMLPPSLWRSIFCVVRHEAALERAIEGCGAEPRYADAARPSWKRVARQVDLATGRAALFFRDAYEYEFRVPYCVGNLRQLLPLDGSPRERLKSYRPGYPEAVEAYLLAQDSELLNQHCPAFAQGDDSFLEAIHDRVEELTNVMPWEQLSGWAGEVLARAQVELSELKHAVSE